MTKAKPLSTPKKGVDSPSTPSGGSANRKAHAKHGPKREPILRLKTKPWLPVLKPKERYVRFELFSEKELGRDAVSRGLACAILRFAGEYGLAQSKYKLIDFSNGKGILMTTSKALPMVIASLTLMQDIDRIRVAFRSLKVAGTLKKIK